MDVTQYIKATIAWNKSNISNGWNTSHPENEFDAYIEPTDANQQIIIDSIECFVFTEYCGSNKCNDKQVETLKEKMIGVTNSFNIKYKKSIPLYKLIIDPEINGGAYKNKKIVSWENNNYSSDLKSLLVKINVSQ